MSAGFGRLVLDGSVVDDPYVDGLEDVASFEVISDAGPRYRIVADDPPDNPAWDGPSWTVSRNDPQDSSVVGSIIREGSSRSQFRYRYTLADAHFSAGADSMLINAVFGVIGESERIRTR